jgi:hypothetical protein
MATVSKVILGAVIAAASIASPALAHYAPRSGPSTSVHHSTHLGITSHQSGSRAFASARRSIDGPAGPYSTSSDARVTICVTEHGVRREVGTCWPPRASRGRQIIT